MKNVHYILSEKKFSYQKLINLIFLLYHMTILNPYPYYMFWVSVSHIILTQLINFDQTDEFLSMEYIFIKIMNFDTNTIMNFHKIGMFESGILSESWASIKVINFRQNDEFFIRKINSIKISNFQHSEEFRLKVMVFH